MLPMALGTIKPLGLGSNHGGNLRNEWGQDQYIPEVAWQKGSQVCGMRPGQMLLQ